jgi:hypothetical protein
LLGPIERLPLRAKRTITEWAEPLIARGRLGDLWLRGAFDGAHGAALCVQDEPDRWTVVRILRGESDAAAAGLGDGERPVRMESVKYADGLMDLDKSSEVEYSSLMDDKSSMNFGAFGAMPVQTMHDPYAKRLSGNASTIKI